MIYSVFFDCNFSKICLKSIVNWVFNNYGIERTVELSERLKNIGFYMSTKAGISLGIEKLLIPKGKQISNRLTKKNYKINTINEKIGSSTFLEINKIYIMSWRITSENMKNSILDTFQERDHFNPIYFIAFSGARGNLTQVRQLIGIRGLIVDPIGKIVEYPIQNNFKEGITITEFLISCYGARKGIIDTALRTARAGYLTRRIIDIAHFQVINIADCNTRRSINIFPLVNQKSKII